MNKIFLFFICLAALDVHSQDTVVQHFLKVGDLINIDSCPTKTGFRYIDYYKKTGFPNVADTAGYDKHTGDGFYDFFFTNGDFDTKVLPCSYQLKSYRVICLKEFRDKKTGEDMRVAFLAIGKNTVAWVNLDLAAANGEIYLQE